ncbi:hypothetical protein [Salinicola sp. MIT1003]|uniref:hypothetical protein n=1 Tax=Salinicola sp. MIT1003 TaxID=1882734 RepID=UPI0008DD43C2|nr:hypothetical protein [Salinicola sp. MIT1003]OHZ03208.1 hypothetical protein BC443_00335 [Salinicola sp. MIT1003]
MAGAGPRDGLRRIAIASQAIGFILIITLETVMGDGARPWQGVMLALMLATAAWLALVRRYRRNRKQRRKREDDD